MSDFFFDQESLASFFYNFNVKYKDFVCVHIHTTGLGSDDEVLSCAAVNNQGDAIYNKIIKPVNVSNWAEAELIHGITPALVNSMGIDKVNFMSELKEVISDYENVLFFNAQFSTSFFPSNFFNNHKILCCMEVSIPFLIYHPSFTAPHRYIKLNPLAHLLDIDFPVHEPKSNLFNAQLIANVWGKMLKESQALELPEQMYEW